MKIQSREWDYGKDRWSRWDEIVEVNRNHKSYQDDFYWMQLGLPIFKKESNHWYRKAR